MSPRADSAPHLQPHPAPQRDRVGRRGAWFALAAAPLAWALQLLFLGAVAAHACYPHDEPLAAPLQPHLGALVAGVELLALATCALGGAVAWRNWRRTRRERSDPARPPISAGEGRSRFMAMAGMLVSGLFLLAVGLTAYSVWLLPGCGR